jgi:glutathione S-transferase
MGRWLAMKRFSNIVRGCGDRPYILGNELSAADIQLSFIGELAAARFGIDDYPDIRSWLQRFQARPAYKAALAQGGAYSSA